MTPVALQGICSHFTEMLIQSHTVTVGRPPNPDAQLCRLWSRWHQGGFLSVNNARSKPLIKGISNPNLAFLATDVFFPLQNEGAVPSAMFSTLPLIQWKKANTRGIGLPSPPTHQNCTYTAAVQLKSFCCGDCTQDCLLD